MEGITPSDTKDTSTPCLSQSTAPAPASAAAATLTKPEPPPPSNLPLQGMSPPQTKTPLIGANATTPSPPTNNNTSRNNHNSASAEAPKSLRGLNKPKCSECGNVARSRCPFQACKSCCVKARNPCHIHVLKQNVSYPEKAPSQSSSLFDQQRTNALSNKFSPSGSSRPYPTPVLHHTHPYMSGSLAHIRVKRPLSRKEIAAINNWRFVKLKEYSDSKIGAGDESFGRYMQNVSLLEDVFSLPTRPLEGLSEDGNATFESRLSEQANSATEDYNDDMLVEGMKVRLKSNTQRSEKHRQRLRKLIEKGLQKLKRGDHGNLAEDDDGNSAVILGDCAEVKKTKAIGRERLKKVSFITTLLDKLTKARNQEDVNACIEMYSHTFGKDILGSAINTDISEEIHSSQGQESTPNVNPSEHVRTFGKDILGSAINTDISEEIHSSQGQESTPNVNPSEHERTFGNDILGSAINTDISEEIHSSQGQESTPNVNPSEHEPTPMEWVGEERRLECSGLFDGQQMQLSSNPEIYIKGWTKISISEEGSQHIYENLLSIEDIAEL